MSGAERILAERQRQISVEGWTPEHDAAHSGGQLTDAAVAYIPALPDSEPPWFWPWDRKWWKPKDRIGNLVRAGALIAAEIDRIEAREKR